MRPPLVNPAPLLTRINVTPIIDVALVLVIILLITAPMLSLADLEVKLPAAHSRDIEDQRFISITVSGTGGIAVDDKIVANVEEIGIMLRAHIGEGNERDVLVVVRADSGLPHVLVREVLEEARASGATRLAIATRQKGGGSR